MSRLNKYLQRGGNVVVEKNEKIQDVDGNILSVSSDVPSHDDRTLIGANGNETVPKGKGGILVNNVSRVLSATTENRKKSSPTFRRDDELITLKPKEAKSLAMDSFGLSINPKKSISPAKFVDLVEESKLSEIKRYKDFEAFDQLSANSVMANLSRIKALPSQEDVFNVAFNYQESQKQGNQESIAQTGKGIIIDNPKDPNFHPRARVQLNNGKFAIVDLINDEYIDSALNKKYLGDSVKVSESTGFFSKLLGQKNAEVFYDSKLRKYIRK